MGKKTVVDAVEWHLRTYGTLKWQGNYEGLMFLDGQWFFSQPRNRPNFVCTREQFEAHVNSLQNGKKTVADVVAEFGRTLLSQQWLYIRYSTVNSRFFTTNNNSNEPWLNCYLVCDRTQYELYLLERCSDEWTHIDEQGSICRIVHTIKDKAWVTYKRKDYFDDVVELVDLQPYEPEWSHLDENNELCKVVSDVPDAKGWIVILKKNTGMYKICPKGHVQPCH